MDIYDICLNKDNCFCKSKNNICFADIDLYCSTRKTICVKDNNDLKKQIKKCLKEGNK